MSRRARTTWVIEALALHLSRGDAPGLSQALYQALRGWIESGELAAGEALPSSRQLACELGIGRNTALAALAALERLASEGFVVTRPGAGLFVASLSLAEAIHDAPDASENAQLSRRGDHLLAACAPSGGPHGVFAPGIPALDLFPREQWQRLLRRRQQRAPEAWLAYQSGGGVTALKTALCDYLRLSRSVRCTPEQLEESELDEQMKIVTLIGIEFDENTVWSELTIAELKLLIQLALGRLEDALDGAQMFLQFNDNTVDRGLFYQALSAVLEIALDDDLDLDDYRHNLTRMFGKAKMADAIGAVEGSVRFPGLMPTSLELDGIERHQRLLESYHKLHAWRAAQAR